ncbi:DUF3987 domain-containing protein [Nostoc punctiforme FACHB-252]|uniref:DUF3987 domain-containing protein n=1 Tax=Nostoc punctiforme FACHB-252 TaxID=1357509 RepID=A0ABR8HM85_NOSPU|nr:DUF3987 domain-containing protein [Nostoc punctiforme]MBD2616257.1 DUF3987 domain-containing protein [Nostoc punctiforme FACHB-252]
MVAQFFTTSDFDKAQLLSGLKLIPLDWALTPVLGNKNPYRADWNYAVPMSRRQLIAVIENGDTASGKNGLFTVYPQGYGLRTGKWSNGILALDADGEAAHEKLNQLGGLPKTVSFTSGKPGRCQYLVRVPQEYWSVISTKKINTGVKGADGKDQLLELRWNGCQSVLPPSVHPETGSYKWVNSPQDSAIAECPTWIIEYFLNESTTVTTNSTSTTLITDDVPLYQCLTKDDRDLIDCGVASGSRDDNGAKLARNLIGTASRLTHLGYRYEGDARQLFDDYCARCSPPLSTKDAERIWKSATKDNPTATLSDDALDNCIKAWQRQLNKVQSSNKQSYSSNPNTSSDNLALHPLAQQPNLNFIKEKFIKLLVSGASKTQVEQFKLEIRQQYSLLHPSELNKFLEALTEEFHLDESLSDEAIELQKLISAGEQTINLADYLPSSLATPLSQYCEWQKIRHAVILTSLLTTVSSLHKVGTELVIHGNLNFKVPPTIFGAIIAESGSKKSPIFRATAREPLNQLKEEELVTHLADSEIYQSELEEWETAKAELKRGERMTSPRPVEPKPPTIFYFTDATGEALKAQAQKAPEKSLFGLIDELAGLFSSQNAYRGGRGSDKQDLLSYFDGTGATVLRAGGVKVDVSRIYLSLLGTIQPDILKKHIGNLKDADGSWSRWLYAVQPNVPSTLEDDIPLGVNITDYLAGLYRRIHNLPVIKYKLSHQAFKLYQPFYNRLEQLRVSHPLPGLRAVYAKAEGYVGRLAMNLHVLHELECNRTPDSVIPVERMREAIELMKFFIGQVRLIHASVEDGDSIAPHIQKVIELSKRKQLGGETGWIKAKDVQLNSTRSQRPSPNEARNWMSQAASLGYGSLKGEGIRLEFKANTQKVDTVDNGRRKVDSVSTNESIDISSFQQKVDKVDTYSPTLCSNLGVVETPIVDIPPTIVDDWSCQTVENEGLLCLPNDQIPNLSSTPAVDEEPNGLSTRCLPSTFEEEPNDLPTSCLPPTFSESPNDLSTRCLQSTFEEEPLANASSVDESQLAVEQTSTPDQTATATRNRAIVQGSRVRVHFPGSKRDGLEGVVVGFRTEQGLQKAIVKLENIEASLRIWECFVPGNEGMRLELVE